MEYIVVGVLLVSAAGLLGCCWAALRMVSGKDGMEDEVLPGVRVQPEPGADGRAVPGRRPRRKGGH